MNNLQNRFLKEMSFDSSSPMPYDELLHYYTLVNCNDYAWLIIMGFTETFTILYKYETTLLD